MNLKNTDFQKIPWDDIVEFGQASLLNSELFTVSWILSRFCNYDCSYCWPYAKSKISDHRPLTVYKDTLDEIKKQARDNGFKNFHFSFSGGEPTAYKKFKDLVEHYANDDKPEYQSFHMTSNCSPSIKWWEKTLVSLKKFNRASITASFHAEFAKEEEFAEKLVFLVQNGIYVTVNQVMVPERFYESYNRCRRLHEKGINVTLKPQSDPTACHVVNGYTQGMLDIMQTGFPQHFNEEMVYQIELKDSQGNTYKFDQAERFNAFGFNKFPGWLCNSGYQSCIIREPGGEVKRSYSCHDERLGTIDEGFKLFKNPMPCMTPSCVSSADSKIPKVKQ